MECLQTMYNPSNLSIHLPHHSCGGLGVLVDLSMLLLAQVAI